VDGGRQWAILSWKNFSAVLGQAKLRPQQILRSGCAQADDDLGMNGSYLHLQPRAARCYFERIWFFMQADFSPRFPFEVLNCIGDIDVSSVDTGGLKTLVKQLPGGSDKWLSLPIFTIAWLLTHQKNGGVSATFAKNDLGRISVQVASLAQHRSFLQAGQVMARGQEL
jgi:hypothetical protein